MIEKNVPLIFTYLRNLALSITPLVVIRYLSQFQVENDIAKWLLISGQFLFVIISGVLVVSNIIWVVNESKDDAKYTWLFNAGVISLTLMSFALYMALIADTYKII